MSSVSVSKLKTVAVLIVAASVAGGLGPPSAARRAVANVPLTEQGNDVEVTGPPLEKDDLAWRRLGMYLQVADPAAVARVNLKFHAGMKVSAVRPNSPAAEARIRAGDILIGLHQWEILKGDDVSFALEFCAKEKMKTLRFYMLQNGEVRRGDLSFK